MPYDCESYEDILHLKPVPDLPPGMTPASDEYQAWLGTEEGQTWRRDKLDVDKHNRTQRLFYNAVRHLLTNDFAFKGELPLGPATSTGLLSDASFDSDTGEPLDIRRAAALGVFGLMLADNYQDPLLGRSTTRLGASDLVHKPGPDSQDVLMAAGFKSQAVRVVQEVRTHTEVFRRVYLELQKLGAQDDGSVRIKTRRLAEVSRQLIAERADTSAALFDLQVRRAVQTSLGSDVTARPSAIDIDLPELEEGTEADIVADNVRAVSAIYFSAMLEELKFFATAEKIVEQFMNGMLPLTRGVGGEALYRYFKKAPERLTEFERRGLYGRTLGLAQGSVDEPMPNREFNDLWIRFLSAVSLAGRERNSTQTRRTSAQQIFKTGRDLGVNLSLHGYALAHFAAVELQGEIREIKTMLSDPDVLAAFGVRDIWQLVQRHSDLYLGGAVNSVRQRTMAQAGANIIQWIASNAPQLAGVSRDLNLTDDLTANVERWLAVTGTPDTTVERFSEPVSHQTQPTIPSLANVGDVGGQLKNALSNLNPAAPVGQA